VADSYLPGDLSYASINTALTVSDIAYGTYLPNTDNILAPGYAGLIDSGWSEVPEQQGIDDVASVHYQGVAFYKVINGVTEVIIGNRGSQPGGDGPSNLYDYTVSDVNVAKGLAVAADAACILHCRGWHSDSDGSYLPATDVDRVARVAEAAAPPPPSNGRR
jgi:hypothetical protein